MEKNNKIENDDIIIKKKKVSSNNKTKTNTDVKTKPNKKNKVEKLEEVDNNIEVKPKKKRVTTTSKSKENVKVNKNEKVLNSDIEIKPEKKKNKQKIADNRDTKEIIKKKTLKSDDIDFEEVKNVPKKKRRLKKKFKVVLFILLFIVVITMIVFGIIFFLRYQDKLEQEKIKKEQDNLIKEVSSYYNEYVKVNEDTVIYKIDDNNNYYEYGMVYANTEVSLDEIEINHLTEYFYSTDLDAYIKYNDLQPISELTKYSERYKNYIVFNQNVVTNDEFSLYDDNNNKVYTFKSSVSFPIIIKDYDGKYYVEFNNRMLYVLKDEVKEIVKSNNTKFSNASKITTLCYHRIYDSNDKCNDLYICKSKSNFEREMKYLSDNKFLTLTMEEMYLYLTKKLQVPKKSVVLTFDDGYLFENGIEILEKYNLHGTGFIKTGSFDDFSVFESENFELQSHTDKMHVSGTCPKETSYQQGGGILCLPENTVLNDLKTSREKLNGAIALAYPFYDYNTRAINLVKQAGFKLAFIGANSVGGRASAGTNTYKIPRMTIWNTTSFETFKGYVNN